MKYFFILKYFALWLKRDCIKINGIGINVYPFDLKKYYNLYALKKMPSWASIKKFDTRIFPKESILK